MTRKKTWVNRSALVLATIFCVSLFASTFLFTSKAENPDFTFTKTYAIAASGDDVGVSATAVYTTGTGVYLHGQYSATVFYDYYLRFTGVDIPADAVITNAYISFSVRDASTSPTTTQITGETSSGAAFGSTVASFTGRTFTGASVSMTTPNSIAVGNTVNTPNLKILLDEMRTVDAGRTSYIFKTVGNGVGSAVMRSRDAGASYAPKLIIEYTTTTVKKEYRINAANNDVSVGSTVYNGTGLYLSGAYSATVFYDNYLRFTGVEVPEGAAITNAYIAFTVRDASSSPTTTQITGETSGGAAFGTTVASFTSRTFTSASVPMTTPNSIAAGNTLNTPDLKPLMDEILMYNSGQTSFVFKFVGNRVGAAVMRSYESSSSLAPKLIVEYTLGGGGGPGALTDPEDIVNVYINEVSNGTSSSAAPWVEFYNANSVPVILGEGMFLTDDIDLLDKYEFDNFIIPANGFKVLYLNGADDNTSANFTLDNTDAYMSVEDESPLIINQVFGGGPSDNTGSISHSFVELYNPTDDPVSLAGWSLQAQNGFDASNAATEWLKLDFNIGDVIPAHSSFLIRLDQVATTNARYTITNYDVEWLSGRLLSNRAYSIALVRNQNLLSKNITTDEMSGVVDLVGAVNTAPQDGALNYEGAQFAGMSKQKSVRRADFIDTDNNASDFKDIDYRASGINDDKLAEVRPRWSGDGAWGTTGPAGPSTDHLIINQVFGGGPNDNSGAITHSFVELYNPTNTAVSLEGWSLQVQNGKDNTNAATEWLKLDFDSYHAIPARTSLLIRLDRVATSNARYSVDNYDIEWLSGRLLSNRAYSIALVSNQDLLSKNIDPAEMAGVVDLVGAVNTTPQDEALNYEGAQYVGMSKQKSVRRTDFIDTDNNAIDLKDIDYRATGISDIQLADLRPRWSGDGAWGAGVEPPKPPKPPIQVLVPRELMLSAYYDDTYHTVDQLPYYSMQFGETYGRFMDGDGQVVKFDNNGTFNASNNAKLPVLTYSVSHKSGNYADPIDVKITTEVVNTIKYTLDGTIPSATNGLTYTGPIHIAANATLRVYIYNAKQNSGVLAYAYVIGNSGLELKQKTVAFPITTGNDDLRATATTVTLTETSLYLNGRTGTTDLTTYLRFTGVELPEDAVITNAYIAFTTRTASTTPTNFEIFGEIGAGAAFTTNISTVNGRSYTVSSVSTQTPASVAVGSVVNSGDLSGIVAEMFASNNGSTNYVFKVEGDKTGAYAAQSYEGSAANCAKLVIEYFSGYDKFVGYHGTAYDIAEEYGTGHVMDRGSSNIEIGGYWSTTLTPAYKQVSGFRFPNVVIPADAEITDAYMEFAVSSTAAAGRVSNMVVKAEMGNPVIYGSAAYDISNRTYGQLSVTYQQESFRTTGVRVRTPNLKDIIDENRLNGWASGQAMAFMLDGDNYIGAVARTLNGANSPRLVVEYKFSGKGPGDATDSTTLANVYINEVSGEGTSASKETWVELYNDNDFPVILGKGTYLSDKSGSLSKYEFDKLLIPAKGFRIVTCPALPVPGAVNANFELSSTGTVYLSTKKASGTISAIDSLTYDRQLYNQTVGRYPDGSPNIVLFQSESYGFSNNNAQLNYQVTVSPDRGVYETNLSVTITVPKPSITIRYAINGATPTATSGTIYTGPISITKNTALKIYAYDALGNSGLQVYTYILKDNLRNEAAYTVSRGSPWQWKSNITSNEYALAMASFPIVSVTTEPGNDLVARADYVQGSFEYIDAHLGKGSNNYFSYAGAQKFGQESITRYNSGVNLRFKRENNTRKAKVNFFDPMPEDPYPTPVKYTKLQLKEGQQGPERDVYRLGFNRYDEVVTHTLGIQMQKYDLRTRYVQYFCNGKYMGLKTLREAFSDGQFENYFGGDSTDFTVIDFQDARWLSPVTTSGNNALLTAIRNTVSANNFQEFKKYVDIEDYIKFQILFMFIDCEREGEGILHNDAYNGGGPKMITNINDVDGAFYNANGNVHTSALSLAGGGGNYIYKWGSANSRRGIAGWWAIWSGDSTSNAAAGNLEFKTLVKDQVLKQIGPASGDFRGAPGAPLSVDNVSQLITANFNELNDTNAYKVDAAYMGARRTMYTEWLAVNTRVQTQLVHRVKYTLERWAAYYMAHTLGEVTFVNNGSGITLSNPNNNTVVYYTTNGTDPMGPDGVVSGSAIQYTAGTVLPATAKLTVRPFTTNNWGPITSR